MTWTPAKEFAEPDQTVTALGHPVRGDGPAALSAVVTDFVPPRGSVTGGRR